MKYMYKFLAFLIPVKKWKKAFKQYCKEKLMLQKQQRKYRERISELKQQKKIKVAFLVWENCKWSYDSLYQKLKESDNFQPIVMIKPEDHLSCNLSKNEAFFKEKGYDYIILASFDEFKKHMPGIVFYEQPWFCFEGEFEPENLSNYSLCLYVPYEIDVDLNLDFLMRVKPFYQRCHQVFVFNKTLAEKLKKHRIPNTIALGHPKMEAYLTGPGSSIWKSKNKTRIIFAPHHSFANSILKWASYEWSGECLLDLAKRYADTTEWIFKPHPRFYLSLIEEFGQEFADKVFSDWQKVSTLCDTGNYFDIFKTADLLISDCGSFRIEWLPTQKPYLYLQSHYDGVVPLTDVERYFYGGYYFAKSPEELERYFEMLVHKKDDPLKETRKGLLKEIPMNSSQIIFDYIRKLTDKE